MAHHTKDKGDLAVVKTMLDLTIKGYDIFVPAITEHLPFDIIAYKNKQCYRIQCKHSKHRGISNTCNWSDKNGSHAVKYDQNDFDYYAVYLPQIDKVVYPSIKFGGCKISITVPNSATPFYWWEDFINFTDIAFKKSYKDFGKTLTQTVTEAVIDSRLKQRKVQRPSKEELEKLIAEKTATKIAQQFGVSDKSIAKWAKAYGIKS